MNKKINMKIAHLCIWSFAVGNFIGTPIVAFADGSPPQNGSKFLFLGPRLATPTPTPVNPPPASPQPSAASPRASGSSELVSVLLSSAHLYRNDSWLTNVTQLGVVAKLTATYVN